MTSTIKVNNIQNQCGANIIKESSNTITLGASGDNIVLASGATQAGFGREGSVNWQTGSIKTSTFTATSGEGYFCNTAGGTFEVDLPAGSAGAIVSIQDYNNTFDSNNLTVDPNGSEKINGGTAGGFITLSTEGLGLTFVYIDATVGWRSVQSNEYSTSGTVPTFIVASVSGACNTLTTAPDCGNFKVAKFIGPGNFTVCSVGNVSGSNTVDYTVVAGGAGAGRDGGGGGGAGGSRTNFPSSNSGLSVTASAFPITVGAGGAGAPGPAPGGGPAGSNGANSIFSSITSAGGGGGGTGPGSTAGVAGGSGGGGGRSSLAGGSGNTPPVSPSQGNNGGTGGPNPGGGGGGGGHSAVGVNAPGTNGGNGGAGTATTITGSSLTFAGGGGGSSPPSGTAGTGGAGGGGIGNRGSTTPVGNRAGTTNTGGGGGGESGNVDNGGGNGGSGIVIIRYKFQ